VRSSRATLYAEQLSELTFQLAELEDLRGRVEEAQRNARGSPALRSRPASRRLRRAAATPSVRLRRSSPLSRNGGDPKALENDIQVDRTLLAAFPEEWWASP
jgi:hypothetical protein